MGVLGSKIQKWTKEDDDFFIKNYYFMSNKELSIVLNRSVGSIKGRKIKLKLPNFNKKISIGDIFNKLIVIKSSEIIGKQGQHYYQCKCDCGKIKTIKGQQLIQGKTKSCGCLWKETHKVTATKPPGYTSYKKLYNAVKNRARLKKLVFILTEQEHLDIILKNCYYCNTEPTLYNKYVKKDGSVSQYNRIFNYAQETIDRAWVKINTVDRLDSNKGYTLDNCVPACWPCNEMKMDKTVEEFLNKNKQIYEFQKKKEEK